MTPRQRLLAIACAALLGGPALAQDGKDRGKDLPTACPTSRAHIEPRLQTRPEDGNFYTRTRQSVRMEIAVVLQLMGGPARAREIATLTRADAEAKLAAGAAEAEKRYYEDTVLRADALLAILDCLDGQKSI